MIGSYFEYRNLLLTHSEFLRGEFRLAEVNANVGRNVKFTGVDLRDAIFRITRCDGQPLNPTDINCVQFIDCDKIEGATVNGIALSDWIAAANAPAPMVS